MQELEEETNTDPLDIATHNALVETEKHVAMHINRFRPKPRIDGSNRKVCLDCEEIIPAARAAIADVVRCMCCQLEEEKYSRLRVS